MIRQITWTLIFGLSVIAFAGDQAPEPQVDEGFKIQCKSNQGTSVSGALKVYRDKKGRAAVYAHGLEFRIPKELSFVPLKFSADMVGMLDSQKMATLILDPKGQVQHQKGSGKVDKELRITIRLDSKTPSIIQNANVEAPIVYCDCQLMEKHQIFMLSSK